MCSTPPVSGPTRLAGATVPPRAWPLEPGSAAREELPSSAPPPSASHPPARARPCSEMRAGSSCTSCARRRCPPAPWASSATSEERLLVYREVWGSRYRPIPSRLHTTFDWLLERRQAAKAPFPDGRAAQTHVSRRGCAAGGNGRGYVRGTRRGSRGAAAPRAGDAREPFVSNQVISLRHRRR